MILKKQCKTCEFNFSGKCAGHGDTYKYGEAITDETRSCDDWSASLDYFSYIKTNAPRFLREPLNDCRITYYEFLSQYEKLIAGNSAPINSFDAIKFIYGISMVDIAVLLNVSFGVVYRAKTKGIPQKRLEKFANALCIEPKMLESMTTADFSELKKARKFFFEQPGIDVLINSRPEWKKNLASTLSSLHLHCPIHMAQEFARVDKLYWAKDMPMDDFTESEKALIKYIATHTQCGKAVVSLEYSLNLSCYPNMHTTMLAD